MLRKRDFVVKQWRVTKTGSKINGEIKMQMPEWGRDQAVLKGQKADFQKKTKVERKNNISFTIMTQKSELRGE